MDPPAKIWEDVRMPECEEFLSQTTAGLRSQHEKIPFGGHGEGYVLLDEHGERVSIFRKEGDIATKEFAAYLLDFPPDGETEEFRVGCVPMVTLVQILDLEVRGTRAKGSLQSFINNSERLSNWSADRHGEISVYEIQKISLIDIRYGNNSRYPENVLVKKKEDEYGAFPFPFSLKRGDGAFSLIPINHDSCFPKEFANHEFFWTHWSQAKVPYCPELVNYVEQRFISTDAESCLDFLRSVGIFLGEEAEFAFKVRHLVLLAGVLGGYSPRHIGLYMSPPGAMTTLALNLRKTVLRCQKKQAGNHDEAQLLKVLSEEIKKDLQATSMFVP